MTVRGARSWQIIGSANHRSAPPIPSHPIPSHPIPTHIPMVVGAVCSAATHMRGGGMDDGASMAWLDSSSGTPASWSHAVCRGGDDSYVAKWLDG